MSPNKELENVEHFVEVIILTVLCHLTEVACYTKATPGRTISEKN